MLAEPASRAFSQSPAASRSLSIEAKQQLQKQLAAWLKCKSEEDKQALLPSIYRHGMAGIEFLRGLRAKSDGDTQVAIEQIDAQSVLPLGIDLIEEKTAVRDPEYGTNYFQAGEIVLFRKGEAWGGFSVTPTSNPVSGTIAVQWWTQPGLSRKLLDVGGQSGEAASTGIAVTPSMRPNSGFTDCEFPFEAGGFALKIRFVGPAAYRVKYGGGVSFAFSASNNPKKILASDKSLGWQEKDPPDLVRAKELLARYIARSIPGCEPLPLTEAERKSFAQYEMVQIEYRQTRPDAVPLLLIKFAELRRIGFQPYHEDYLVNLAREVVDMPASNLVLMAGSNRSPEANQFLVKHQWSRPPKELVQLLRANFPEEG